LACLAQTAKGACHWVEEGEEDQGVVIGM